ncbi:MAG: hypothetical protein HRF43_01390 [Phycisphaerae bacterium]
MGFSRKWIVGGAMSLAAVVSIGCSQNLESAAPQAAAAVKSAFPGTRIVKSSTESDGGMTLYEATLTGDGKDRDVLLSADGSILEVETQITMADLPEAAAEAIRRIVGDGKITVLEKVEVKGKVESGKVVALDPPTVFYEVKYRNPWGWPGESQVAPDGGPVPGH